MNKQEALDILNSYKSDDYYGYGKIPQKKINMAMESYSIDKSDEILALIDTTVFGSAKTGMAIGLKGVYFKNDWTTKADRSYISWNDLRENISQIKNGSIGCIAIASGCEFNMSSSSMKRKDLIELLKRMAILENNDVSDYKNDALANEPSNIGNYENVDDAKSSINDIKGNSSQSNFGTYVFVFISVFIANNILDSEPFLPIAVVMLVSLCYMIYFIVSEKLHYDIFKSLAISLILIALAAASGILIIPLIIWVLYNISKTIESVKSLKSSFLYSAFFYILLGIDSSFNSLAVTLVISVIYGVTAVNFAKKMEHIPLKFGLMQLSVMFLSIPLIVIMVGSIFSGIKNIFNITFGNVTRGVNMPQNVAAHMRGDVAVSAYTRNVSTTVTETVTKHVVGTGAATIGVTGSVAKGLEQKEDNDNRKI